MLPAPILVIVGSGIAIMLGGSRVGPIIALILVGILSYLALTSTTLNEITTKAI